MIYNFPATVARVIDGDTIAASLDLGFDIAIRMNLRFNGCNAAEVSTVGGKAARDNLTAFLPVGTNIAVRATGWDKYGGRADADITLADGRDLVTLLISEQWAAAWDGHGTRPVPPWPRTVT